VLATCVDYVIQKKDVEDAIRWGLKALALLAFIYSIFMIAVHQYWIAFLGDVSPFTLGSVAVIYLLTEWSLTRANMGWLDATVLSILFANVFIQSYELIYHFSFPIYLNYFRAPFVDEDGIRYLMVGGLALSPAVIIRSHLSFKRLSFILLAFFVLIWAVWILYGFPQYFADGYFYPTILRTNDSFTLSLTLNFGSKVVLAAFFVSLLDLRKLIWHAH